MFKIITAQLSKKLYRLLNAWVKEENNNREHDVQDNLAWNELVAYLMELESHAGTSKDNVGV